MLSYLLFSGTPKHWDYTNSQQDSNTGETETSPFGVAPQKARMLDKWSNSFSPQGEAGSCRGVLLLIPWWAGGSDHGKWVCASVFSDPKFVALSCQHLDSGKIKISPSGSPLKSLQVRCIFQSFLSLHREMPEAESFLMITLPWAGKREVLWQVIATNFPIGFDVAGFALIWGATAGFY